MNAYAKAVIAALAAGAATANAMAPHDQGQWLKVFGSAFVAGLLTYFVPNTKGLSVDPPLTVVPPKAQEGQQ